jgi:hypothetical protein
VFDGLSVWWPVYKRAVVLFTSFVVLFSLGFGCAAEPSGRMAVLDLPDTWS